MIDDHHHFIIRSTRINFILVPSFQLILLQIEHPLIRTMSRRYLYRRIAEAIGETVLAVERMREAERKELMVTLGLGESEVVYEQIAAATGESVDSIISMREEERTQLIQATSSLSPLL